VREVALDGEEVQFSFFMHPDQAQNTSSGIQGQEATAVAVIYVTAAKRGRWKDWRKITSKYAKKFLISKQTFDRYF